MFPTNSEIWKSIDCYKNYEVSWFGRVRNARTGRILKGGLNGGGYLHVNLSRNGKATSHCIHKLVAHEWIDNPDNKKCVDHIDGNKHNNHVENLRYATHSENGMNRKTKSSDSSPYKGVHFYKPLGKYVAYISLNGKRSHLGYFSNEREAAEAYNQAAVTHFGVFAKLHEFD